MFVLKLSGIQNALLIYYQCKKLRTPTNMFIVNLAFSDFSMMLTQVDDIILSNILLDFIIFILQN